MTVAEALVTGTNKLTNRSTSPRLDAEVLLAHILHCSRMSLLINSQKKLTTGQSKKLRSLILERANHTPIPYLTGQQEFFGLTLNVTPAVLVPRPFTELLVENVIKKLKSTNNTLTIADIGTGTGAIAIALATNVPRAKILATDIYDRALAVAKKNARQLGLTRRIVFQKTSLLDHIRLQPDIIIANLPYLTKGQLRESSISREPRLALYGGSNGLRYIQTLIEQAKKIPRVTTIALEFDPTQLKHIRKLLKQWSPTVSISTVSDGHTIRGLMADKNAPRSSAARSSRKY